MIKLILIMVPFLFITVKEYNCKATWYDTTKHKKVYRQHSTAAVSVDLIKDLNLTVGRKNDNKTTQGSLVVVTNISNGKLDTVEITDVSNGGTRHIDLCLTSFERLSKKNVGTIKVKVKKV